MHHLEHDIDEFDEDKSKTDVKREMHQLQDFALMLMRLPKSKRNKLPLNEDMQDAMVLADKIITKPDALRRHARFVAKLLLEADKDAIQAALDVLNNKHQQQTLLQNKYEQMADDLIAGGNDAIESLLTETPTMERQKLRQLVRQAAKEVAAEKKGKGVKNLIAYIKEFSR
ncbi:ribosome biogenesis factor YjgA [Colwellia sp. MEBiC06753]